MKIQTLLSFLLSLVLSVDIYNTIFAQQLKCGTIPPPLEKLMAIEQKLQETKKISAIDYPIVYIPVKPWIIRKSDGTGWLTEQGVMRGISAANEYFIKAGFQFYICDGFGYINDDKFYNLKNEDDNMLPTVSNVINIYYPFSATLGGGIVGGYTYQPPSLNNKVCIIYHHADNERTLAHELGHYFYLLHTNEFGNELVNSSNCSVAGDMVCDTKADPGGLPCYSASECTYTGTCVDANGDSYTNPPMYNAMGYLYCGSYFTQGQYERMRNAYNSFLTDLSCNIAPPANPTNLVAELSGYNIILNWEDNASTEIGYIIERYDTDTEAFYSVGITGANETVFTDYFAPANQPVQYRVKPINSANAFSNIANINSSLSYCRPHYANKECSPAIFISDFSLFKNSVPLLENLSNGCSGDNYSDFATKVVQLDPGTIYNFRIRFGLNSDNTYQKQYTGIFIDFNQDGDFDDSDELVYQGDETTPYILEGSFIFPVTAKSGFTRMRIRTQDFWGDYKVKDACERRESGEVEDYTVAVSSVLPLNLLSFKATLINHSSTLISWSTSDEYNVDKFLIQRSIDAQQFETIASIEPKPGSTSSTYRYTDLLERTLLTNQHIYYRLEIRDKDGSTKFSNIKKITVDKKTGALLEIYPNPVNNKAMLFYNATFADKAALRILDINGRLVNTQNLSLSSGVNIIPINTETFQRGVYIVEIKTAFDKVYIKIIKN